MEYVAIVSALALIEYSVFGGYAGWARGKFGVAAPATVGHPQFERYYRIQHNTLEQLIVFLPALWLFGLYLGGTYAALIGCVFLIGRLVYFLGYRTDAEKRGPGFLIGELAVLVLLIGGLIGAGLEAL